MSAGTKSAAAEPQVDNGGWVVLHRVAAADIDFHEQTGLDVPAACGGWGDADVGKANAVMSSGGGGGYGICEPCEAIHRARF